MKPCNRCGVVKPSEQFAMDQSREDGLALICRDCNKEKSRQWYRENRAHKIAEVRAYKQQHGYSPTTGTRRERLQRVRKLVEEEATTEFKLIRFTESEWLFCLQQADQLGISPENYVRFLIKDAKLQTDRDTMQNSQVQETGEEKH